MNQSLLSNLCFHNNNNNNNKTYAHISNLLGVFGGKVNKDEYRPIAQRDRTLLKRMVQYVLMHIGAFTRGILSFCAADFDPKWQTGEAVCNRCIEKMFYFIKQVTTMMTTTIKMTNMNYPLPLAPYLKTLSM